MRKRNLVILLLVLVAAVAGASQAGVQSDGQDPRWTEINQGLPHYAITTAVTFDPEDDNLVYAAAYYRHGVYRSEDGGRTWQIADQGLSGAAVYSLAASPNRSQTIYAGAADGLYRSTDGARSWQRLPLPAKAIYALLIPRGAPDRIYAGSFAQLFVSSDGGASWTSLSQGLENTTIISFAVDDSRPEIICAGTSGAGLLRTTDGGASWTRAVDTEAIVAALSVSPRDGTVLARLETYLLRGTSDGRTWEKLGALPGGRRPLSLLALPGTGRVLAGSEGDGIYSSDDGGETWLPFGEGLQRARVTALAVSHGEPSKLLAGTPHGVYFSHDGGLHWERGQGTGRPIVRGLFSDEVQNRLLAGTTDGVYEWSEGRWRALGQMKEETLVLSIASPPDSPETLYAGTWGASVQQSVDGGKTWQLSAGGGYSQTIIPAVLVDPDDSRRVYARVEYDRLIVSENGGGDWRASDVGLFEVTVLSLSTVPSRPGLLYAGTDKGLYRSPDRGASWSSTVLPAGRTAWSGSTFVVVVDRQDVEHLTVGTTSGVFHSRDGGRSWTAAQGLEDFSVSSLVFSGDGRIGFAGTRFAGVYRSQDGGSTWLPFGSGLADVTVNALVLNEPSGRLVAGTEEGVFVLKLPQG